MTVASSIAAVAVLMTSLAEAPAVQAVADPVSAGTNNVYGNPTPEVVLEANRATLVQPFSVEIDNSTGGAIEHVQGDGTRTRIGSVERPASGTVPANDGFWASKYSRAVNGGGGHVVATSVYVLRLKAGPERVYDPLYYADWRPGDRQDWRASLINVRPDRYNEADHGRWQPDTIYTNIPGGTGIFGGSSSPPVGSSLAYYDPAQRRWRALPEHFAGDFTKPPPRRLRFTAYTPVTAKGTASYLEFENWAAGDTVAGVHHPSNGRILLSHPGHAPEHIADVMQRVRGTGRFGGTEFARIGQIDTNHPGALTLSTSPNVGFTHDVNERGGLQIVPANHAKWLHHRLGQGGFIGGAQWMLVGPAGADRTELSHPAYVVDGRLSVFPGWEAIAPLFGMYVRTSARFVISLDHGRTWRESPNLTGVHDPSNCTGSTCVHNWTNIRLYLTYA